MPCSFWVQSSSMASSQAVHLYGRKETALHWFLSRFPIKIHQGNVCGIDEIWSRLLYRLVLLHYKPHESKGQSVGLLTQSDSCICHQLWDRQAAPSILVGLCNIVCDCKSWPYRWLSDLYSFQTLSWALDSFIASWILIASWIFCIQFQLVSKWISLSLLPCFSLCCVVSLLSLHMYEPKAKETLEFVLSSRCRSRSRSLSSHS